MIVPEFLPTSVTVAMTANPLLAMVAAPLFLSAGLVPLVLQADTLLQQEALHPLDVLDPAGWNRSHEWLVDAPIEKEYCLKAVESSTSTDAASVAEHAAGRWRTLRRHGSVQSVTLMEPRCNFDDADDDEETLVPFHASVGNEYLKVMASAYAALSHPDGGISSSQSKTNTKTLHLGLGGGTLPMLIGEPCTAIELDQDAVDLAIAYCGLDPELVSIVRGGDALHHRTLVPTPHGGDGGSTSGYSCIFVDVFDHTNNVPTPFVEEEFIRGLYESLDEETGGLVIANFHCHGPNKQEDLMLQQATRMYARVFNQNNKNNHVGRQGTTNDDESSCVLRIPSRYQGNMIVCARKGGTLSPPTEVDRERARQVATTKGWMFDPGTRLHHAETIS
mmetsp:Transcript_21889/g.25052  ORF Transcript_21889/g.25052 Transcript_21889/m.25052 type:complete len:390 (-) Transcript_21889:109-1278(-)